MERLVDEFEANWISGRPCAAIIGRIIKLKDTCPKCKRTRNIADAMAEQWGSTEPVMGMTGLN